MYAYCGSVGCESRLQTVRTAAAVTFINWGKLWMYWLMWLSNVQWIVHSLLWGSLWGFLKLAGTRSRSGPVQWIRYWSNPSSTPFGYSIGCEIVVRQLGLHPIAFGRWGIVFYAQIQLVMCKCDSGFMPREYYRLLVHQHRIVSLGFLSNFWFLEPFFKGDVAEILTESEDN